MKTNLTILFMFSILAFVEISQSKNQHKCHSNHNMKYQLNQTSELRGYYAVCSDFSKRTCCSGKNFESLAKKISSKLIASQHHGLSFGCRRKLTNLLCSTCDGDIGQKSVDGVCVSYCTHVYQACKEDFFAIDFLNKIKVCRDDDIVCSKLVDILPSPSESRALCEMFDIDTSLNDCWNGVPSSQIKGIPKIRVNYHQNQNKDRRHSKPSFFQKVFKRLETKHFIYFGFLGFLISLLAYKWLSINLKNRSRMIKNL